MNPLTLDFVRRWKWVLLVQFLVVTGAWIFHAAEPQSRMHLEIGGAIALSWDLMRGLVRSQLGLPQRRESVAAGLWSCVAGVGVVVQVGAMLLGGLVLAPCFGREIDPGALSLHMVLSVLLTGSAMFFLTGLPSAPPRNLAGQVKAGVFGLFWGLSMWAFFGLAMIAPVGWREVTPLHWGIMALLSGLAVASWFTTRTMIVERAMPIQGVGPAQRIGDLRQLPQGPVDWRLRLGQEARWFLPIVLIVVLTCLFMFSINGPVFRRGAETAADTVNVAAAASYQSTTMGMLCVMTVFPLLMVSAGSLRACRAFPLPVAKWVGVMTLRPFAGGLLVFVISNLVSAGMGRPVAEPGPIFLNFLPVCAGLSLVQAVVFGYPRFPVMIGTIVAMSFLGVISPVLFLRIHPGAAMLVSLTAGLLALSGWLHWRALTRSSGIYRLHQGFLRMMGGAQR